MEDHDDRKSKLLRVEMLVNQRLELLEADYLATQQCNRLLKEVRLEDSQFEKPLSEKERIRKKAIANQAELDAELEGSDLLFGSKLEAYASLISGIQMKAERIERLKQQIHTIETMNRRLMEHHIAARKFEAQDVKQIQRQRGYMYWNIGADKNESNGH